MLSVEVPTTAVQDLSHSELQYLGKIPYICPIMHLKLNSYQFDA